MKAKIIKQCIRCPYYSDEGQWCDHPDAKKKGYLIIEDAITIDKKCPLPDVEIIDDYYDGYELCH